jgi:hypothetical protein
VRGLLGKSKLVYLCVKLKVESDSPYTFFILEKRNVYVEVEFQTSVKIKLYNDQRNAQVFNLFNYLFLPYMFRAFF